MHTVVDFKVCASKRNTVFQMMHIRSAADRKWFAWFSSDIRVALQQVLDKRAVGRDVVFIGEELVEITRKMFPLSRKREDTFIGGLSMGGFGALRNGLKYHDTFGAVICLSGALHVLENPEESRADSFAHEEGYFGNLVEAAKSDKNPAVLIEQLKEARKKDPSVNVPTVFQACGTEDGLLEVNRLYHKRMEESGMDIVYYESKGGHEWDFWDEWIKKALDWLPLEEKTEGLNSGNVNV